MASAEINQEPFQGTRLALAIIVFSLMNFVLMLDTNITNITNVTNVALPTSSGNAGVGSAINGRPAKSGLGVEAQAGRR